MPKKNPFDYLKAKKGEKTCGEVKHDPHLALLSREFLMDFYRWEKQHDPDLHKDDESRKRLLDLIITYKEINKINRSTRRMNKLLHKPVQGGDAKAERVMEAASKKAEEILAMLLGERPDLITTDKGKELAVLLMDLIEKPSDYIAVKGEIYKVNLDTIDKFLSDRDRSTLAKEALHKIL